MYVLDTAEWLDESHIDHFTKSTLDIHELVLDRLRYLGSRINHPNAYPQAYTLAQEQPTVLNHIITDLIQLPIKHDSLLYSFLNFMQYFMYFSWSEILYLSHHIGAMLLGRTDDCDSAKPCFYLFYHNDPMALEQEISRNWYCLFWDLLRHLAIIIQDSRLPVLGGVVELYNLYISETDIDMLQYAVSTIVEGIDSREDISLAKRMVYYVGSCSDVVNTIQGKKVKDEKIYPNLSLTDSNRFQVVPLPMWRAFGHQDIGQQVFGYSINRDVRQDTLVSNLKSGLLRTDFSQQYLLGLPN